MDTIRLGIVGYGNIGRGVELAVKQCPDMELVAVFTRRPADTVKAGAPVHHIDTIGDWADKIDVMMLCGGSATDLPEQGPALAKMFHTIDSFDTHQKIPAYFDAMDNALKASGHVGIISCGWDPGLFSLIRLYAEAVLPEGETCTFWGPGVSQGHSDAIRRIPGVRLAVQYTIPKDEAVASVRAAEGKPLTTRDKHLRRCFVVAQDGADTAEITARITEMPNYFAEYDTEVNFISEETYHRDHAASPHGGFTFRNGHTAEGCAQQIEFSLKLASNPSFTSSILVAFARAAFRLSQKGETGARTPYDIPPALLSPHTPEELRRRLL